jgi:hypothetical protein
MLARKQPAIMIVAGIAVFKIVSIVAISFAGTSALVWPTFACLTPAHKGD